MKKINPNLRTRIDTISAVGMELSDQALRLVSGGLPPREGGTKKGTKPASMTNPGEVDTATDSESD